MRAEGKTAAWAGTQGDGGYSYGTTETYQDNRSKTRLVLVESRSDDGRVVGLEPCWLPLGAAANRALSAALRARRGA